MGRGRKEKVEKTLGTSLGGEILCSGSSFVDYYSQFILTHTI